MSFPAASMFGTLVCPPATARTAKVEAVNCAGVQGNNAMSELAMLCKWANARLTLVDLVWCQPLAQGQEHRAHHGCMRTWHRKCGGGEDGTLHLAVQHFPRHVSYSTLFAGMSPYYGS